MIEPLHHDYHESFYRPGSWIMWPAKVVECIEIGCCLCGKEFGEKVNVEYKRTDFKTLGYSQKDIKSWLDCATVNVRHRSADHIETVFTLDQRAVCCFSCWKEFLEQTLELLKEQE